MYLILSDIIISIGISYILFYLIKPQAIFSFGWFVTVFILWLICDRKL